MPEKLFRARFVLAAIFSFIDTLAPLARSLHVRHGSTALLAPYSDEYIYFKDIHDQYAQQYRPSSVWLSHSIKDQGACWTHNVQQCSRPKSRR